MNHNKPIDDKVKIFRGNSEDNPYSIQVSFNETFLEDLAIEQDGQVSAEAFISKWLQALSQEKSKQGNRKIGGYTINQLIFDPSIAYNPNKKKGSRKVFQENKANKLEAFKQQIIDWLYKGVSHCEIAKRLECHIRTLRNYIKTLSLSGLIGPDQCGA